MIDHLRHMAVFACVVEEGSFRAAAKKIGLVPSRISETVSELEKHLGVTLLYRSTRKISLTSEGRILYSRVADMIQSAESGLDELNALAEDPAGSLRISMPAFLATGPLSTAVAGFARRHPKVSFSVSYTDHMVRLVEDGFDMIIRVGWLDDSAMMSRKLGDGQRVVVAGVEYAKQRPVPQQPSDLDDWDWIRFEQRSDSIEFTSPTGETQVVSGNSQVRVDSIEAVNHLAVQNVGVAVLPSFLADRGIAAGQFVRLVPEWSLRGMGIYAVWPDRSRRESLTLHFVRFMVEQSPC